MSQHDVHTAVRADVQQHGSRENAVFMVLFWVSALLPLVLHVLESGLGFETATAAIVLALVAIWLHKVHAIHRREHTVRRGITILLVLYAAFLVLSFMSENYILLLFGVYSVTFGLAGSFRTGLYVSLIPTLIWAGGWIVSDLPLGAVATPFFVWATSNVISYFMHQLGAQNEERGRLLREIAQTRDELAAEERRRGTLEERARVAGEIHDTLAQGFTSIVLLSKGTSARLSDLDESAVQRNLHLIEETARDNLADARRLVEALRPAALDELSLPDAIGRLAARHTAETDVPVRVELIGTVRPLGGSDEVLLLRSVQEALANARKHSDASAIDVTLTFDDAGASVSVVDDGRGFDPSSDPHAVAGGTGGQGLAILRDRVGAVDGEVDVQSVIGEGTRLTVRVPTADVPAVAEPR